MSRLNQRKIVRVLFDEFHSESWTISELRAREIQPEEYYNSSYEKAATALGIRDFVTARNVDGPLHADALKNSDVLVLLHPCDPTWERTTSSNSPKLSPQEIVDIESFVRAGGGLIVVSEYENEKYGNNLNELLCHFGLQIENTTVSDHSSFVGTPNWVLADCGEVDEKAGALHCVNAACFYRAGSCTAEGTATIAVRATSSAHPRGAGFIGQGCHGTGRVVVVTDSDIFGDEFFDCFDHSQLWLNLAYWVAAPTFFKSTLDGGESKMLGCDPWLQLKSSVNELRRLQSTDGSINMEINSSETVHRLIGLIVNSIDALKASLPHQESYISELLSDLQSWVDSGFAKPDFARSLAAFQPQADRRDNVEHLAVFTMYTPNASLDMRMEALIIRVPWPDWLANLERTRYSNEKFVPGHLLDFTEGYNSECAVLFPDSVSLSGNATNNFGVIFCDREAQRYQKYVSTACKVLQMTLPSYLECFLGSLNLIRDAFALWDLIHDRAHGRGHLPYDPFIFRKKLPFWMYSLEELRVDLASFCEAVQLSKDVFPFAISVTYAVLFDRIFRFAIVGERVKNYDALGGQLLFSFLHKNGVVKYLNNTISIRWDLLNDAVIQLRNRLDTLYSEGVDIGKVAYWIAAHDLISEYVKPNIASVWKRDARAITHEGNPRQWVDLAHEDEFPLGQFFLHLRSRVEKAITS